MMERVGEMTKQELWEMLEAIVEQKILELLGDPDEGFELRKEIRARLERQRERVLRGDRGIAFEALLERFGE